LIAAESVALPEAPSAQFDDDSILNQAAMAFAVLAAIPEDDLSSEQVELVRSARETFRAELPELGLDEVTLFDHVVDHVNEDDWQGLGLAPPED
jgi:hypothetical protein